MSSRGAIQRKVDVVILTAIKLEYQAVLQVEAGALAGSQWKEESGPNGLPVAFREFQGKGERPLRVAVAQAGGMGVVSATNALLPLVDAYSPRCVAMCGVCAGRPGKTNLGDVVAAERLFIHDAGKRLPDEVQQDLKTYVLREDWKVALEHFDFAARFQGETWWTQRPFTYEWQENWVLAKLHERVADPSQLSECAEFCPQWEQVIESLWTSGYVQAGELSLTDKGRARVSRLLIKHRRQLPDLKPTGTLLPFKVHVAPIGSGNQVVEDETVWSLVSESMRKTLGLEMEAAALGALAHAQRERKLDALVMKGVMDFANTGRDDQFKEYAARASAECLLAFLREQLEVEAVPGTDDLLELGTERLPKNPPPSALLNARYTVVPFHEQGREAILEELERWCDAEPPVAVRLIHAEGGVGKTRLAMEWARRRIERGWAAGFLAKGVPEDWFERLWARSQPVLVVIDYAESRADLLATLMRVHRYSTQQGSGTRRRMRLLLLARNSGDWWQSLRDHDTGLRTWLDETPPSELHPLATEKTERERVFREAAAEFAKQRGKVYENSVPVSLSDERFERVLYLHMAALASVEDLEFEVNTLMDVILDHEEHFWETSARKSVAALSLHRWFARQVVAAATLRGGIADQATAALVAGRILDRALHSEEEVFLRVLHHIYQHSGRDSSVFLPALEPDLLGEGMVLRVISPKREEDRRGVDWLDKVFPSGEEARVVGTGLEVLGRASATQPAMVKPWLERLVAGPLRLRARLALEAAKAVGMRTEFSVLGDVLADRLEADGDVALAHELEEVGIPYPSVSLTRIAEWTNRTLLGAFSPSQNESVLGEKARLLNNLGNMLSEQGRREEALDATSQATTLYRDLAKRNPEAFRPALAMNVNNLGNMLSELGRRDEALKAAEEAVKLYRELVQHDPDGFQLELAKSLNNLGAKLSELGRGVDAFKVTSESVSLYRDMAERNPNAFHPEFAMGLGNLGVMLKGMGRREEALDVTSAGVDLYRVLARNNPDTFRPNLATFLSNLAAMLIGVGRHEEALEAASEAVDIHRALAKRHPSAFRPDLAVSLNNLGTMLKGLRLFNRALEATRDAVDIHRDMAERNPDAFRPELASSLNSLGGVLSDLGRIEDALMATREAVGIQRELTERNPNAFRPNLASSLNNLGVILSESGRREEALETTNEAVTLYRNLAEHNPGAFGPALASSLNNLGRALNGLGRREEALKALHEALDLHRALARCNPNAFGSGLATSLFNCGHSLTGMGCHEEALAVTSEAVDLYRALAQHNPKAFQPDLARSLNSLGNKLGELGRHDEALMATSEAVDLYRALAHSSPDAFRSELASCFNGLGIRLSALGRFEDALGATLRAVNIQRSLVQSRPRIFRVDLADSLNNMGAILNELGRLEDALNATHEALELRRELAQAHPDAFRTFLADSLNNLGAILARLGRLEEALASVREAVELRRVLSQSKPDVFRSSLSKGLTNLSSILSELKRREEALASLREALDVIWPFFERFPSAFAQHVEFVLTRLRKIYKSFRRPLPDEVQDRMDTYARLTRS
jgi:tetratricopeptide (TPR) repeat protein/nucleoside phosphorylase